MERLDSLGSSREKSLLVHGLYLSEKEVDLLNARGGFLAHNPRSNMNNNVGYCTNIGLVERSVLGTDGCGGNMFEELKIAFFKHKDLGGPWWPSDFVAMLSRGNEVLESYFEEKFGRIEAGYKADITVRLPEPHAWVDQCSYPPCVGTSSNCVESVMVEGQFVMFERQFDFYVCR